MVVALVLKVKVQRAQEARRALEAAVAHAAQPGLVLLYVLGGSRVALMAAVVAVLTRLMPGKGELVPFGSSGPVRRVNSHQHAQVTSNDRTAHQPGLLRPQPCSL